MVGEASKKRSRRDGFKRKHDRNKFRKTTNATIHRKDLGNGLKGFLFSCTPHHENQCFRDGVLLLGRFCEHVMDNGQKETSEKPQSLQEELSDLRSKEGKAFTRVDGGVNGSVFVKINNETIDIEQVVESALRDARQTGNPGSRHCIRLMPIYTTCYAKAEDAAKAAAVVVKERFPKIQDKPVTYAIAFRSRINNSAKRDDFIPAVAAAVENVDSRYKVNLTAPDVVLIVEVLKTSCCIGVFRHYYQLAKMNLREAACPSKPNESNENDSAKPNKATQGSDNDKVTESDENDNGREAKPERKKVEEADPKRDETGTSGEGDMETAKATSGKDNGKAQDAPAKDTANGTESAIERVAGQTNESEVEHGKQGDNSPEEGAQAVQAQLTSD